MHPSDFGVKLFFKKFLAINSKILKKKLLILRSGEILSLSFIPVKKRG